MSGRNDSGSLSRLKRSRFFALFGGLAVLAALVAYGVFHPDPEEKRIGELRDTILGAKSGGMSAEKRRELRAMVDKLSPEARKKLIREVMRGRLEEFRAKYAGLTLEQKRAKVGEIVARMRNRFANISPERRKKIKETLNSEEGKKRMREAMGFYYTEFTAEERSLFDPVVEELSVQLNSL